ncbi:hypothetical protein LZ012_06670 [Dechloromonas sp. XY25]|uniref:PXPV repeat-containing protein n=1 Tax=Dechloromonas hankyongensis TaxID=2908002 RepID=A0ABS9K0J7_9RHOO|nr:hypothetical protein [Dechloromonas hankyongensis]MCG2576676.1 hypothetical protein [Dechloromonas hankyongensis]
MKTLRAVLLGLALSAGLLSAAHAHGPNVGISVQAGYPAYYAPPPAVYYAPPRVVYAPPPPPVYVPRVVVPSYGYSGYYYDEGPRYGWREHHHRHHGEHRHWR